VNIVIDYGVGNVGSVINAFDRIDFEFILSDDISLIKKATRLVFPGVGNFNFAINELQKNGLVTILDEKINNEKIPTLGICLGMHLLASSSAESNYPGLGFLNYDIKRLKSTRGFLVPHIGWDYVTVAFDNSLTNNLKNKELFYFSHSYALMQSDCNEILLSSTYGENFVAAFQKDNLVGTQFHPEKSGAAGEIFLQNFCKLQT
jgi:glutamine amidotransferase